MHPDHNCELSNPYLEQFFINCDDPEMMETIKNWLKDRFSANEPPPQNLGKTSYVRVAHKRPRPAIAAGNGPEVVEVDPELHGRIESIGPGKNVLVRNRIVREDSGTHETLKIVDDSMIDTGEEAGIDPYNTGGFDRSKNWDQRFRK